MKSIRQPLYQEQVALLLFGLGDNRYALHLDVVERVLRIVEAVPLPGAPAIVLGLVNVQGLLVPVVDIRRRFSLPARSTRLSDQLIIAHTGRRTVALPVDTTLNVIEIAAPEIVGAGEILEGIGYVQGVVRMPDGLVLIHDLASLLSLDEHAALTAALRET